MMRRFSSNSALSISPLAKRSAKIASAGDISRSAVLVCLPSQQQLVMIFSSACITQYCVIIHIVCIDPGQRHDNQKHVPSEAKACGPSAAHSDAGGPTGADVQGPCQCHAAAPPACVGEASRTIRHRACRDTRNEASGDIKPAATAR